MAPRIGIVGRGYWGDAYKRTLEGLGIPHWQEGRKWFLRDDMDGLIVACSSHAHYEVAKAALSCGLPVIVEKPVTLDSKQAFELVEFGGIAFDAHIRLYDTAWRAFKGPGKIKASAGGVNPTNLDALWNWLPHLVAMCLDVGAEEAHLEVTPERQPLRFAIDGREYVNHSGWWNKKPTPLEVLVTEFCEAIERGEPDNERLKMGARVVEITERIRAQASGGRVCGLFSFGD